MKIAIMWNRFDIAQKFILTGNESLDSHERNKLMEMALMYNKPKFVEYFLETGLKLDSFLRKNFEELYLIKTKCEYPDVSFFKVFQLL